MADYLDLRDLADEWAEVALDEDEIIADATVGLKVDPRFPRLHLALLTHNAIIEREEAIAEEVAPYVDLAGEIGCDATPDGLREWANDYEPMIIHEDSFIAYAEELANDIGAVDDDAGWPNSFIDWEAAADALRADYTAVTYDGADYLLRSW